MHWMDGLMDGWAAGCGEQEGFTIITTVKLGEVRANLLVNIWAYPLLPTSLNHVGVGEVR